MSDKLPMRKMRCQTALWNIDPSDKFSDEYKPCNKWATKMALCRLLAQTTNEAKVFVTVSVPRCDDCLKRYGEK